MKLLALLFCICCLHHPASSVPDGEPELHVTVLPATAFLDEPIKVTVSVTAPADSARQYRLRTVTVSMTVDGCRYTASKTSGVTAPNSASLSELVWRGYFNPQSWPEQASTITRTGTGEIEVTATVVAVDGRGDVETRSLSARSSVVIRPLAPETIKQHVENLRTCLSAQDHDCQTESPFFSSIRDPEAAELLIALLKRHPTADHLVYAIVNQGRPADAVVLRGIAENLAANRSLLVEAAEKLLLPDCRK